jgi:glycosyltransferase involved in cell wall biosynthesis
MKQIEGKRLLIAEEGLIDFHGHFYTWIKAIKKMNENAGVKVTVAGNINASEEIKRDLGAIPAFTRNNWSDIYNKRGRLGRFLGVWEHNRLVYDEVAQVLENQPPFDAILCPAVRIHHLKGWKRLCHRYLGKKFERLVLFMLTSEAIYNEDYSEFSFKRTSWFLKRALQAFKNEVANGQVVLSGDSHVTCGEYEQLSGIPFEVFPSPGVSLSVLDGNKPEAEPRDGERGPVFVMLGVSYFDKGIDLLQSAILKLLDDYPSTSARFVIQWAKETIDYGGKRIEIDNRLRESKSVTLLENVLSETEYQNYFSSADFIVLPYRRRVYFNRISGVAVEAACRGIPVISTENTWLSWAMKEFGAGVNVRDNDSYDLYNQLLYCIANWEQLRNAAAERRQVALAYNSAENYLSCLWGRS